MKYVLAKLNVYGDPVGFWTESFNSDEGTMSGKIVEGINETDAKMFTNYEDAFNSCKLISDNCDILLRIIPFYNDSSIYNNKNDYRELQRIVSKYPVEELAKVINYSLMQKESVKLSNELNFLNSKTRPSI